jgi:hypothetical protein
MNRYILFIACCFLGFFNTATAQNLFLPQSLNTTKDDYPAGFAVQDNTFYFAGTRWPGWDYKGSAASGFCYRTDTSGTVLNTFTLAGIDSQRAYTFESVHAYRDQVYIVATQAAAVGPYFNASRPGALGFDGYNANRLLVLRLDAGLNLKRIDTLQYRTDTSDISTVKSLQMGSRLFIGYSSIHPSSMSDQYYTSSTGIAVYSPDSGFIRNQQIGRVFIAPSRYGDTSELFSLTPSGTSQLVLAGSFVPQGGFEADHIAFRLDTNLVLQERIGLGTSGTLRFSPANYRLSQEYTEFWKPTESSSYFVGPVFTGFLSQTNPSTGNPLAYSAVSIARVSGRSLDSVTLAPFLPVPLPLQPDSSESSYRADKQPMVLLQDRKSIVVLADGQRYDANYQNIYSRLRVAKYDTSLNLIWKRDFEKTYAYLQPVGIHELPDGRLMVLATIRDYLTGSTEQLYCFILDSNGTALHTFTVGNTAGTTIKAYPNPTQASLKFELPEGQSSATFRILDLQGRIVLEGTYRSGAVINMTPLVTGQYLYQVQTAAGAWQSGLLTKD